VASVYLFDHRKAFLKKTRKQQHLKSALQQKRSQQPQDCPWKNINSDSGSATTLKGKARQDFKLAFTKTKGNRDSGGKIANVSLKHFRRIIEESSRL